MADTDFDPKKYLDTVGVKPVSAPTPTPPAGRQSGVTARAPAAAAPANGGFDAAKYLTEVKAAPPAPPKPVEYDWRDKLRAVIAGNGNAASLGHADETNGLLTGAGAAMGRMALDLAKAKTVNGLPLRGLLEKDAPGLKYVSDSGLQGILEQAGQDTAQNFGMRDLPTGVFDAAKSGYISGRDDIRADEANIRKVKFDFDDGAWWKPTPFTVGQFAGSVPATHAAMAAIPEAGGAAIGSLRFGPKVVQAAKVGAAMGAGTGEGNSNAAVTDSLRTQDAGGIGTLAGQSALGGVLGGSFGAVASKASDKLGAVFKRWAEENAYRAGGLGRGITNQATAAGLGTEDKLKQFGRDLLNEKLIPWFGGTRKVLEQGLEKKPAFGELIDKGLQAADESGAVPRLDKFADDIQARLVSKATEVGKDEMGPALKSIDQIRRAGQNRVNFSEANQLKSQLGDAVYPDNAGPNTKLANRMQRDVHGLFRNALLSAAESVGGPEAVGLIRQGNKGWGLIETLEKLAGNTITRDAAKDGMASGAVKGAVQLATSWSPGAFAQKELLDAAKKFGLSNVNNFMSRADDAAANSLAGGAPGNALTWYFQQKAQATLSDAVDPAKESAIRSFLTSS
jgi:hypothetical protein